MPLFNSLFAVSGSNLLALMVVAVWTVAWQGLALWHAARYNQRNWFIALIILNFAGLLPIIYLIWYRPPVKAHQKPQKKTRKLENQQLTP
jgi:hypothetical protein